MVGVDSKSNGEFSYSGSIALPCEGVSKFRIDLGNGRDQLITIKDVEYRDYYGKCKFNISDIANFAMNDAEGKPVRVKDIAKRQEVSGKYLEQIVSVLTKAGYLRSIRGPQGGYLLTKHPNEYTVGMILRITEGSMEPVPCLEEGSEVCERMEECITIPLWRKLNEAISGVLDHTTLADLIEWHYAKNGNDYVI